MASNVEDDQALGLCLSCLVEHKERGPKAVGPAPKFACTLAPTLVPVGPAMAVVAVPTCYDHIAAGGSGLLAVSRPLS